MGLRMEPVTADQNPEWTAIRFTGNSLEFFKIWIVNVLLTLVTLGLYSPWAKVRTLAYFHGNTWIRDSSFAYLADPVKILKGRIIAVMVFAIYWICTEFLPEYALWALSALILLFPFIMVTAMSFRMRNTAYRNIRFYFRPDYWGAYSLFMLPLGVIIILMSVIYLLITGGEFWTQIEQATNGEVRKTDYLFPALSLSLLPVVPYIDYLRRRFIVEHTQYGTVKGQFQARARSFYNIYLIAFLLFVALGTVFGVIMGVLVTVVSLAAGGEPTPEQLGSMAVWLFAGVLIFYAFAFFVVGYLQAALTNVTLSNTILGPVLLSSELRGRHIGWLYLSNTLAIIASAGMLIPWSRIRMARYIAAHTMYRDYGLDQVCAQAQSDRSAIGEEIGDMFDFDFGL